VVLTAVLEVVVELELEELTIVLKVVVELVTTELELEELTEETLEVKAELVEVED
jgi:hypothetical protein